MDPSTIYRELLATSEARAAELETKLGALRAAEGEARGARDEARDEVTALRRELARLEARVAELRGALDVAQAEVARVHRYPDAYPGFEQAHRFFVEALEARPPMAPFLGFTAPLALAPDRYAARYRAYLGRTPCTVRIALASERGDDARGAWELETRSAIELALAPGTPGLVTVLAVGDAPQLGFIVTTAFADSVKTLAELSDSDGLTLALERTLALLHALEAREQARCRALLPDANAIAIHGRDVTLLEPTALHAGDLTPDELRHVTPAELARVSLGALQSAWVAAAGAMFTRLIAVARGELTTGIARAAQHSREPFTLETRLRLGDLIARATGPVEGRPTLLALRHGLRVALRGPLI